MKLLKYIALLTYIVLGAIYYLATLGISLQKKEAISIEEIAPQKVAQSAPKKREVPTPYPSNSKTTSTQDTASKYNPPSTPTPTPKPTASPIREIPPKRLSEQQSNSSSNSRKVLSFSEAIQRAEDEDAYAQAVASIYYAVGYKTEKDTSKAADLALASAKQRNPLGIYRLAAMMENGDGFEKNVEEAKKLKEMAFEGLNEMSGDPYALTALGVMLFRGEGGLQQNR
jgi:outer membrane biosynthesis protein TonB